MPSIILALRRVNVAIELARHALYRRFGEEALRRYGHIEMLASLLTLLACSALSGKQPKSNNQISTQEMRQLRIKKKKLQRKAVSRHCYIRVGSSG